MDLTADPVGSGASSAGLGSRAAARALDALLVGIPASAVAAILRLPAPTIGLGGTEALTRSAVTGVLWLTYYVLAEGTWGTTVGKRLLGLRVVADDGAPPSHAAATLRNAWLLLGLIPWVGGIALLAVVVTIGVTIARDERDRGLHDHLAGTTVVS